MLVFPHIHGRRPGAGEVWAHRILQGSAGSLGPEVISRHPNQMGSVKRKILLQIINELNLKGTFATPRSPPRAFPGLFNTLVNKLKK
jgi:hypothetical protein